jgi:hypothetical protein
VVEGDTRSFELVGGGAIHLRLEGDTLEGEFDHPRGALPAAHGALRLTRAR